MDKKTWRDMQYGDSIVISKLVAEYDLFSLNVFPYTHCKARVWQEDTGKYFAYTNIRIKDTENNTVDGIAGMGKNEQEALNDLIKNFLSLILQYEEKWGRKLTDDDYEYTDPADF